MKNCLSCKYEPLWNKHGKDNDHVNQELQGECRWDDFNDVPRPKLPQCYIITHHI